VEEGSLVEVKRSYVKFGESKILRRDISEFFKIKC